MCDLFTGINMFSKVLGCLYVVWFFVSLGFVLFGMCPAKRLDNISHAIDLPAIFLEVLFGKPMSMLVDKNMMVRVRTKTCVKQSH